MVMEDEKGAEDGVKEDGEVTNSTHTSPLKVTFCTLLLIVSRLCFGILKEFMKIYMALFREL
jgi:hypothetical protein